jgi:hypothetical protein
VSAEGRHPSVQQIARWLEHNPNLPDGVPLRLARLTQAFAAQVLSAVGDWPELTAGLRKLVEAKDCFVRAAIEGRDD